jgi:hypothetical protein
MSVFPSKEHVHRATPLLLDSELWWEAEDATTSRIMYRMALSIIPLKFIIQDETSF